MELTDITRVETLCDLGKVNEYLALGWKIINHYTTCYDTVAPGYNHQTLHYALAWFGPDPQFPPKPTYPGVLEL